MRRLIVNADDFGLTAGVNRAIAECHERGLVSSSTLMANSQAVENAVALGLDLPKLSIGCHVVLVDGAPVLSVEKVPNLASSDGRKSFAPTLGGFIQRVLSGRIPEEEIEAEATAQFQKLQSAGVAISHFDTHKHTHVFPAVLRPLIRAARACGIVALRNPFVPSRALAFDDLRKRPFLWKRYLQVRALRRFSAAFLELAVENDMATPDGCLGVMETGFLDDELFAAMLRAITEELPEGTWELVCHPGYNDAQLAGIRTRLKESRVQELRVLTSPEARTLLEKSGIELISFKDLTSSP